MMLKRTVSAGMLSLAFSSTATRLRFFVVVSFFVVVVMMIDVNFEFCLELSVVDGVVLVIVVIGCGLSNNGVDDVVELKGVEFIFVLFVLLFVMFVVSLDKMFVLVMVVIYFDLMFGECVGFFS